MSEDRFIASIVVGIAGVILLIVAFAMFMSSASCHAQAAMMGYPATWGPLQDCMIEVAKDKWVPGRSYRYWPNGDQPE